MRKALTWLVVTLGIAALVRKLQSRRAAATSEEAPADTGGVSSEPRSADDPAEELRERLATTREAEAADEPLEPQPTAEPSIDERRTEIHDEGRAALDEMRKSAEDN